MIRLAEHGSRDGDMKGTRGCGEAESGRSGAQSCARGEKRHNQAVFGVDCVGLNGELVEATSSEVEEVNGHASADESTSSAALGLMGSTFENPMAKELSPPGK